ncbi:Per1-like protein [Sodiomyces alkalinus F11]|uniref:Post-GPI attachment to proteins factor 3 n=1 Tax=Sodiomyces alkalinus (strain CBS 110278 / VKM F-3762 / F11) TaxID=1314773 RepID=A0A3N2PZ50_SODAK|nr:Per1-like protein [Sodiomyces alkalinus F11]ROT39809.1 Per1-like protein [Sodiomyces alkalinus F11]
MLRRLRAAARPSPLLICTLLLLLLAVTVEASIGDRLPEFQECVQICKQENCNAGSATPIPLHRRLLFWTCPAECDYTCQHIITNNRVAAGKPIVQFHGKWPFYRFLGMQEPASVVFSLGNLWAHYHGIRKLLAQVSATYPLLPWYRTFAAFGIASWIFSAIFHTRDFAATEQLDYFAAGASVLYGLHYTPIRLFRLDRPTSRNRSVLRAWSLLCCLLYTLHVAYLKGVRWDYTYNMAANVVVGMLQNGLWVWFSYRRYKQTRRPWAFWPNIAVAFIMAFMSLELFDFAPLWGMFDAHSLWHLGTIAPTLLWYNFLIKDSQYEMAASNRLKS